MENIDEPRRKFLQTGIIGVITAAFGSLTRNSFAQSVSDNHNGIIVREDEGIHILTRRKVPITIKISKTKK
jgi:hypothetical protein